MNETLIAILRESLIEGDVSFTVPDTAKLGLSLGRPLSPEFLTGAVPTSVLVTLVSKWVAVWKGL